MTVSAAEFGSDLPPFVSGIPGVVWPPIIAPQFSQLACILNQMEGDQWLSAPEIKVRQFGQLDNLLRHAFRTVPYYRDSLRAVGYTPGDEIDDDFWRKIPVLSRDALNEWGLDLKSQPDFTGHDGLRLFTSSGSTGQPIRVFKTGIQQLLWQANTIRHQLWHGIDFRLNSVMIRPDANIGDDSEKHLSTPSPALGALFSAGPATLINSTRMDVAQQLVRLKKLRPAYLLSMPSNLAMLAELSIECGERLLGLRAVRSFGERVGEELHELINRAWGVDLIDVYSATEVGYMGLQCPMGHYHVPAETIFLEVLDDVGKPCRPGEVGRIVVTPLHAFAMPLIRYQINDFAEVGEVCDCDRGLFTMKRIMGRTRNLCVTPDGRRFWPSFPAANWIDIAPIRRLQLVQTSPERIKVCLEIDGSLDGSQQSAFRDALQKSLSYPFELEFSFTPRIELASNGKFEDFISMV